MRIATMKGIDARFGRVLCQLATPFFGARQVPMPPAGDPAVKRIALVKFWGMGSIVLMTPAIAHLRARYPGARITFITQAANHDVTKLLDGVDETLLLDVSHGGLGFLKSLARLVRDCRARTFDLWLDAEFLTRFSALLTAVSGAAVRVGFTDHIIARGRFHEVGLPFNGHAHMTANFAMLAAGDVQPLANLGPLQRIVPRAAAIASLDAKLQAHGIAPGVQVLVLNPNAGELALERRWSVARFAALADSLHARGMGPLVTIGGPAERGYVAGMLALAKAPIVDLSGQTDLDELVALFARAGLVFSNDTGPLHLACAVGARTVSVFGPETPVLFGPQGPNHRIVSRGLACSPCLNIYNGRSVQCRFATTRCVEEIDQAMVMAAIDEVLAIPQSLTASVPPAEVLSHG